MNQGPAEVQRQLRNHANLLNLPPVGHESNYAYGTMQLNLAPAQRCTAGEFFW